MGPEVVLRAPVLADSVEIMAAIDESRAELGAWMTWWTPAFGEPDVRDYIVRVTAERERSESFEFGIYDAAGAFVGNCGINRISRHHRYANLGYWIRTSRTGQGLATAAVRKLAAWGFANTDLYRLEIVAALGNVRSQRVAERAGATREGVLRQRQMLRGVPHDEVMYALLREGAQAVHPGSPRA
jgi:RimJ/RimL family protein N-acetyltransferase